MDFNEYPMQSLMYITNRPDVVFTHGSGSWLYDNVGKRYLDFIQGWAVNGLGHSHPAMIAALEKQARLLINPSPAFYNEPMARLAALLTELSVFDKVFFANSGAEANEGAIKLARKWGRKFKNGAYEIITFDHSFHGRTLATMSASGKAGWDTLYAPQVAGFPKAELNDIASVERLIGEKTVAVMLEPIQGEAGVIPATREFMHQLRELTRRHGLLLIVDEVQSGCGRAGTLFAYELAGIEPDIMTLGKGIAGGAPLAALLATEQASCFEHGDQGGTFNGSPLMCAAGLAIVGAVNRPEFLQSVIRNGLLLASELQQLSARHALGGIRGRGMLQALDLKRPIGASVVKDAMDAGLLLNSPRPDSLRFMPALNASPAEITEMIEILDGVLTRMGVARCVA
jgi:acetylornithine/N-succinyldiaminopimelate aminotransferase